MENLITSAQLGQHLSLTPATIRRLTRDGDIPHLLIGKAIRYRLSDVMAQIADNKKPAGQRAVN